MSQETSNKTEIALIKKDIGQLTNISTKLERAIESIYTLNNNISSILKLHESKIEDQDKDYDEVKLVIEERRKESLGHVEDLHKRINAHIESDLEMHNVIDSNVNDRVLKSEAMMSKRMGKIEKIQWTIVGGVFVISFILTAGSKIIELLAN